MKYLIVSITLWWLIIWGISAILGQDTNDLDDKVFEAWSDTSSRITGEKGDVLTDVYVQIAIIDCLSESGTEVWPGLFMAGDCLFALTPVRVASIDGRAPTPESMRRLKRAKDQINFTLEKVRSEDGQIVAEVYLD